ncbi:MAG: YadA-like family protein [Dialister sp.]|nr:YadA-like family protein [Dialister sp.]
MNRIYKVVWSKAKNCYTVVSEIAKRHGNGNRARTCAAAFLAAFALTGVMGMSEAQAAYTTIDADTVNADTLNAKYNLNVGEQAANGFTPFFVDSNGAFHAAANEFSVNKDGKVTAAAGEIGGVTIKEGNITGVKAINTSAINTNVLNSKYNLSVGTANENGTMPFFVNSNGAFYAANGKLVVDKDGNVTAGNVVLNNGVYTGNSKLIDGELFVGDASGSYSQITPNSAKLGQVTIDEKGNIAGVNSIQTNAINTSAINTNVLNAKYNLSVGTANENGTMPFFVNSNGAFYAANGKLVVDKDGNVTAGNVVLNNGVHIGNSALRDGELFVGDASGKYSQITTKGAKLGNVIVAEDGKISGVAAGTADTDAVNVGQLNKVVADAVKDAAKASDVGNISDIHKDLQNKDGSKTTVVDAVNNLDNKVGDLKYSAVTEGDIKDGDNSTTAIGKLNKKLSGVATVAGQHSSVSTKDANILINDSGTNTAGGKDYQLSLNQNQNLTSVTTGNTKMDTNGVTVVDKDTNTKVTLTGTGLSINGKTYVSEAGLNANGNKVTQVADGKIDKGSTDAVNGGQLYATNQRVEENASNISLLGNSINKLDNRVDKVGAGAAALAALHPLGFDPEDKWDFAAGYGNYSGASAVALGAYYRPNEDTMFSVGGSFGNGENMVNAGVSLKLGQSNHAPTSKEAAMEKKISSLSQEVEELKAAIADLRAAQTKAKDATEKDAQKK